MSFHENNKGCCSDDKEHSSEDENKNGVIFVN